MFGMMISELLITEMKLKIIEEKRYYVINNIIFKPNSVVNKVLLHIKSSCTSQFPPSWK